MVDRIQRKRTKGWRMPPNTKCVTRPGKWGNPFPTAAEYRDWLGGGIVGPHTPPTVEEIRADLRGYNLGCYCRIGADCHADVLIEVANG